MINIQKYYLVHIGPFWSMLVHSAHFGSIWSTFVLFSLIYPLGPIGLLWSYSVLFIPTRSTLVHFVLLSSLWSYSILLFPIWSYSIWSICVHFGPFRPLQFILVHFSSFLYTCIQGKDMFRLRVPIVNPIYIYIYIKLIISKILSITFIVTTPLLSHINITFQSTSVQLNLSESLLKH